MPNLEWEVRHRLVTPVGTLDLNVTDPVTLRRYQVFADYRMGPTLRVTEDNLSQAHGSIPHSRWKTGVSVDMEVRYFIMRGTTGADCVPACGQDLREMDDLLKKHLDSLLELSTADQRLYWYPDGYGDQKLLDDVLVSVWPTPVRDGLDTGAQFSLESPYPYAIDSTEVDVAVSGSATIVNNGNADFFPVIEVSASSAFTITNSSVLDDSGNAMQINFDATLPGGRSVGVLGAEINTFRGTIFAGGDGADLIASLNPSVTDFIYLKPGNNNIVVTGTTATFKTNNAWA